MNNRVTIRDKDGVSKLELENYGVAIDALHVPREVDCEDVITVNVALLNECHVEDLCPILRLVEQHSSKKSRVEKGLVCFEFKYPCCRDLRKCERLKLLADWRLTKGCQIESKLWQDTRLQ